MNNTIIAVAGIAIVSAAAILGFGGSQRAAAVEESYVPAFFAGRHGDRDWCAGFGAADKTLAASAIATWLDLDATQRTRLAELADTAESALKKAETLCPKVIDAQRDMDLPDQLAIARKQLAEADIIVAAIEQPLSDFYAALTPEQRKQIREHRRDDRWGRSWRHRRHAE